METCVVTGGAGFIGSALVNDLLKKYRVVCVDDLSTGSMSNISHHSKNKNFTFVKADINKKLNVPGEVHYVFHLASPAIPIDYLKDPIRTAITNSFGTINVLELAAEKNAKFLLASSSDVYGYVDHMAEHKTGATDHTARKSCYYEGKKFAETVTMLFHRKGLAANVARLFNTYGPNMRVDGTAISIFVRNALTNKPVTINGDGTQIRTFCYVDDVVAGLEAIMFSRHSGEIFNLGSTEEVTISGLFRKIKEKTSSSSATKSADMPDEDPMRVVPDISKVKTAIKWEPKTSLDAGLAKTIEWFRGL